MKTIITTITTISLALTGLMAQTQPPQPPTPNTNSVSVHSDETKSSTSYSYSVNGDEGDDKSGGNGNVSMSTNSSDDSYSFRLRYNGNKDDKIKKLLYKELGTNNLEESNGKYVWLTNSGGEEVYEIKFSKGKLRMDVDKSIASEAITQKIVKLGKSVRTLISGKKEEERKAQKLQREADRLQREADRMRREANRLQQHEQRNIDRIKREADRLAREANRAGYKARRNGGVSAVVTDLLKDSKTLYNANDNGTAWVLPKLLPLLTAQLKKDGFLKTADEINILKEDAGMYVNGSSVSNAAMGAYNSLFREVGIRRTNNFSLNKTKNHIVLVDDNANIATVLGALMASNIISKKDSKVVLEINGATTIKNGEQLSASQTRAVNELLLQENVMPAPGKTFTINGKNNYSLGYSLNNGKTHIGTWVMGR